MFSVTPSPETGALGVVDVERLGVAGVVVGECFFGAAFLACGFVDASFPATAGPENRRDDSACHCGRNQQHDERGAARRRPAHARTSRGSGIRLWSRGRSNRRKLSGLAGGLRDGIPQRGDELGAGRVALAGVFRQRPIEDGVELAGQRLEPVADRRHGRVDMRSGLGGRRVVLERPHPGQELIGDDPEPIEVARRRRAISLRLLGREIAGGAEHRSGQCQGVEAGRARDAEVGHVDVSVAVEEEVAGLHVAMDDTVAVGGVERDRGLFQPAERLRRALSAVGAQAVVERPAAQVLHHDERTVVPLAHVEDRHRVRLARQPSCRQRLAREPLPDRFVRGVALGQHLHGNRPPEHVVGRAVDLAHAALADQLGRSVSRRQNRRLDWRSHG